MAAKICSLQHTLVCARATRYKSRHLSPRFAIAAEPRGRVFPGGHKAGGLHTIVQNKTYIAFRPWRRDQAVEGEAFSFTRNGVINQSLQITQLTPASWSAITSSARRTRTRPQESKKLLPTNSLQFNYIAERASMEYFRSINCLPISIYHF